jgi:RNA polymerase II subunit A small phosphatase-like protein
MVRRLTSSSSSAAAAAPPPSSSSAPAAAHPTRRHHLHHGGLGLASIWRSRWAWRVLAAAKGGRAKASPRTAPATPTPPKKEAQRRGPGQPCQLPVERISKQQLAQEQACARGLGENRDPLLGPSGQPGRVTLVLDLDETLVHSNFEPLAGADCILPVDVDGELLHIYACARPGLREFLLEMSELFEVIVYTAGLDTYARAIMRHLIPPNCSVRVLTREACVSLGAGLIVKDLSLLNRPLNRVLLVDNSPAAAILQPANSIIVESYVGYDEEDDELKRLATWLRPLANVDDVCPLLASWPPEEGANLSSLSNSYLPQGIMA